MDGQSVTEAAAGEAEAGFTASLHQQMSQLVLPEPIFSAGTCFTVTF